MINVLMKFHDPRQNVLSKCHEDWATNVSSRLFTCFHYIHIEKTAPPPGGHISIKTNVLTKFHDDWTQNVTSRVFTSFFLLKKYKEKDPPPGGHEKNVMTKFHEDWANNVSSRLKTAPLPGGHVFSLITTIFKLNQDIHKTYVLTKKRPPPGGHGFFFYRFNHFQTQPSLGENVSSRLFTCFHLIHKDKTAPLPGGHVFPLITTIFKLVRDIHITNVLTKFHDD
ncbi:hypothetical protein DPMN_116692 [Dreissena polymorpha]|uniref:Uncharacterized protein n=1 Tax=Dreissena polymorpha TaxID=45954 RepID=A0A9D4QUI0_DREPO|nr:hypothetical protein DPMN_116692 [Dreissena polymorpha]